MRSIYIYFQYKAFRELAVARSKRLFSSLIAIPLVGVLMAASNALYAIDHQNWSGDWTGVNDGDVLMLKNDHTGTITIPGSIGNITIDGNNNSFTNLSITRGSGGINLTVKNLRVSNGNNRSVIDFPGSGNTLLLAGNNNAFYLNGSATAAAVHVGEGQVLTVKDDPATDGVGTLIVIKGTAGAGIGGNRSENAGTITIENIEIDFSSMPSSDPGSASMAAMIGGGAGFSNNAVSGNGGHGGTVTITGADTVVNAYQMSGAGAGIGGGYGVVGGAGGQITIGNGAVISTNNVGGGDGKSAGGAGGKITIDGGAAVSATNVGGGNSADYDYYVDHYVGGEGDGGSGGVITVGGGATVNAYGGNIGGGRGKMSGGDGGEITIEGGAFVFGHIGGGSGGVTGGDGGTITISDGAQIDMSGGYDVGNAGIGGGGGGSRYETVGAGVVQGGHGGKITISGDDTFIQMLLSNYDTGAGIGGGAATNFDYENNDVYAKGGDGGVITIEGGMIWIQSYTDSANMQGGAGIGGGGSNANISGGSGSGKGGDGGTITIRGGKVVAKNVYGSGAYGGYGAGIGGGAGFYGAQAGVGGDITIAGGEVIAMGGDGAGLGGGSTVFPYYEGNNQVAGGDGGAIKITGGTVFAHSAASAGVGGGYSAAGKGGAGGTITITDGKITASGIGGGNSTDMRGNGAAEGGDGGTILIEGGEIFAYGRGGYGGGDSAAIGGGGSSGGYGQSAKGGSGGAITIKGGEVHAFGGVSISDAYYYDDYGGEGAYFYFRLESSEGSGAGIGGGGGGYSYADGGDGGTIAIEGGIVQASSLHGAAIGGGGVNDAEGDRKAGSGGTITISGGTVTALGGYNYENVYDEESGESTLVISHEGRGAGAAIGGGGAEGGIVGAGGAVVITNATVDAKSANAMDIGGGASLLRDDETGTDTYTVNADGGTLEIDSVADHAPAVLNLQNNGTNATLDRAIGVSVITDSSDSASAITSGNIAGAYSHLAVENGVAFFADPQSAYWKENIVRDNVTVRITADPPPAGQGFFYWAADPLLAFTNINAKVTDFTMPPHVQKISAQFMVDPPDHPPLAGQGVTVGNVGYDRVELGWGRANDDNTAQENLIYYVYRSALANLNDINDTETKGTPVGSGTDISAYTVSGLAAETQYYFNVIVKDEAGNKALYKMASATTLPIPTYTLTVTAQTGGHAAGTASGNYAAGTAISIEAVTDADYDFSGWQVSGITVEGNPNPLTFTMPGNAVEVTAQFTLAPVDHPPIAGQGVRVDAVDHESVTLGWDKAGDDITGQEALIYHIYQSASANLGDANETEINGTPVGSGTDIDTYTVSGLSAETQYYFNVIVEDEAGNKASYEMVSTTTLPVPILVYPLTVIAQTGGGVIGTASGNYTAGTPISIEAVAGADYDFSGWQVSGITVEGNPNPLAFTMPGHAVEVTAQFIAEPAAPTIDFISPPMNAVLGDSFEISVLATDPGGVVQSIVLSANGTTIATLTEGATSFLWDIADIADGVYTLKAVATSSSGKTAETTRDITVKHIIPEPQTPYTGEVQQALPAESYGWDTIVITGRAKDRATGQSLPNAALRMILKRDSFQRRINIVADDTGSFNYRFIPQSSDAGTYQIAVLHPEETDFVAQSQFTINRISANYSSYSLNAARGIEYAIPLYITASVGTGSRGVRWVARPEDQPSGTLPAGITVDGGSGVDLPANSRAPVQIRFKGATQQETGTIVFTLLASNSGTAERGKLTLNWRLSDPQPALYPSPTYIETGTQQDTPVSATVTLTNKGLAAAYNVRAQLQTQTGGLDLPDWVSLASGEELGTIDVGEKQILQINAAPGMAIADGFYRFRIMVTADNAQGGTIPVLVAVSQAGEGHVRFEVSDLYTNTLDEQGRVILGVNNASITVQNETVTTIQKSVRSNAQGVAEINNLPPGAYRYRASAANRIGASGRFQIIAGVTVNQSIFLDYQPINVEFNVTETTVQDHYDVVVEATYQTQVPAPVVLLQPTAINLPDMQVGEELTGELTLSNFGLVRADNVVFTPPKSDEYFEYEFLAEVPQQLEAKARVTIPYRITMKKLLPGMEKNRRLALTAESGALPQNAPSPKAGTCSSYGASTRVSCEYECANGQWSSSCGSSSGFHKNTGSCGGGGGGGAYGGGGGGGGGGSGFGGGGGGYTPGPVPMTPKCDPDCPKGTCCK